MAAHASRQFVERIGEDTVHSSADSEKIAAISGSAMPIWRPIAGSTDCRPLLPAATTKLTAKIRAKAVRDRLCGGWAGGGAVGSGIAADHTAAAPRGERA